MTIPERRGVLCVASPKTRPGWKRRSEPWRNKRVEYGLVRDIAREVVNGRQLVGIVALGDQLVRCIDGPITEG